MDTTKQLSVTEMIFCALQKLKKVQEARERSEGSKVTRGGRIFRKSGMQREVDACREPMLGNNTREAAFNSDTQRCSFLMAPVTNERWSLQLTASHVSLLTQLKSTYTCSFVLQ